MCSMIPGIRISSPSHTASTSISFPMQIFIYQDRMLLCDPVDDADKFVHILIIDGDLHALSAQYIGRTNQYRIAQLIALPFSPLLP